MVTLIWIKVNISPETLFSHCRQIRLRDLTINHWHYQRKLIYSSIASFLYNLKNNKLSLDFHLSLEAEANMVDTCNFFILGPMRDFYYVYIPNFKFICISYLLVFSIHIIAIFLAVVNCSFTCLAGNKGKKRTLLC